ISAAADRDPNNNHWYNADVKINFTCSDDRSGIKGCAAPQTPGEGANQSVSGTATDAADNTASTTIGGIGVDKTPPTLSGAPTTVISAPSGWVNNSVTIELAAADSLSSVKGTSYQLDGGAEQAYDSNTRIVINAEGVYTIKFWSQDNAGNVESVQTATVKID